MTASLSLIRDERYLEHDPGRGHPESPNRLKVIHALIDEEFRDIPVIYPRIATEDELALIHDPLYISRVAATEGRPHTQLDADTGLSAKSYETARLAVGGLLQAVDALLAPKSGAGSATSVFAFVRPPGHHAEPHRAMGFCLFNNVAIAAEYARQKYSLGRVLIVDWDLHHGNGTQNAFYEDPGVLFFSSHQYPHYPGTGYFDEVGRGRGEGFTVNAALPSGFGDAEYILLYERILKPIALEYRPELVLVSAGFDAYIKDPLGGMALTAGGFRALAGIIKEIATLTCGGRIIVTLEGGYNPEGLRLGAKSVLEALESPIEQRAVSSVPSAEKVISTMRSIHGRYWKGLR